MMTCDAGLVSRVCVRRTLFGFICDSTLRFPYVSCRPRPHCSLAVALRFLLVHPSCITPSPGPGQA